MQITIDIPDEFTHHHAMSQNDWLREIAIALFQQELITLGTASSITGMHSMQFQELLYDRGIDLHYDITDYQADIESLRENNWR